MKYAKWLLLIIALHSGYSAIAAELVHEYQLANGLKLIVKEDHRAPVVTTHVWYKVGSAHEPGGLTGISHVVEHMMFKGTKNHANGEFSKIIAARGGKENAFTSRDFTGYYQNLNAKHLAVSFKLEADRMRNLVLKDEDFAKEIEVVKEERRMRVDDNPNALTYERFMASAHISSPYHHMTIGWMNDLNHLSNTDLKRWYQTWYAPNNATLIVVGDVKPPACLSISKKIFW